MECLNQALVECVKAAGGSAIVGPKLWPEKTREAAQRTLLDHLNPERPAKLSPEQVLLILRLSREKGFHGGVDFILDNLGYSRTTPVEPRDEAADLMRRYVESIDEQKRTVDRMERIAARMGMRSVA